MTIIVAAGSTPTRTYQSLQDEVANWLARDDMPANIKRFIQMAESDICKDLRVRGMEKQKTFSLTSGVDTLPSDFKGARSLYVDAASGLRNLDYLAPEVFHRSRVATMSGSPQAYTVEGNSIYFAPAPGATNPVDVKMLYIGKYDELVEANDSNGLLTDHFNLYLYGALYHGFAYLRDDEQAGKYLGQYSDYVAKLNRNANRERFRGNNLKRFGGPTP